MIQGISHDLRLAMAGLRRRPAFAVAAIAVLGLGIGAATAIYSVVHSVLLRPLPLEDAERLVWVWSTNQELEAPFERSSEANLVDWRQRSTRLQGLVGAHNRALTWRQHDEADKLSCLVVTTDFFDVLGAQTLHGRTFSPGDEGRPVVMLTEGFWRRQFGADPAVLGRTLVLDNRPYEVIGVLPAEFGLPRSTADVILNLRLEPDRARHHRRFWVFGRLADGATLVEARAEMSRIAADLAAEHPQANGGWTVTLAPLRQHLVRGVAAPLWTLFGAVALLLVIACSNVAQLLLANATGRERAIAVHRALGASEGRLVRRGLFESLVLTLAGGTLGLMLARVAVPALLALESVALPRVAEVTVSGGASAFAGAATLAAAALCAVVQLVALRQSDLPSVLRGAGRHGVSPRRVALRRALVVVEVALALVLLSGAALVSRSFSLLGGVDPGFDSERLAVMRMFLKVGSLTSPETIEFFGGLADRLEALPGVQAAGASSIVPLSRIRFERVTPYATDEVAGTELDEAPQAEIRIVTPGYFATLEAPRIAGRWFDRRDVAGSQPVAIVNQALARRAWPGASPDGSSVGRRLHLGYGGEWKAREVVGVVADVRYEELRESSQPAIYVPHTQLTAYAGLQYLVRTVGDPASILPALERAALDYDPDKPAHSVTTYDEILAESVGRERFASLLMGILAALSAVLAASGLYAVVAFLAARRTREIGVRMALGARPRQIYSLVMRGALGLGLRGVALGLAAAAVAGQLIAGLLYGIGPRDPMVLGLVSAGLLLVVALASWLPARRAMRVDPLIALRQE